MADVKISALPAASTPLTGGEVLPIVQSSTTKQVAVSNLTAGLSGTASININGTVGATTATTGAFTSGTFSTTLGVTGTSTLAAVNASGNITGSASVLSISKSVSADVVGDFVNSNSRGYGVNIRTVGLNAADHALRVTSDSGDRQLLKLSNDGTVAIGYSASAVTIPGTLGVTGVTTTTGNLLLQGGMTTTIANTVIDLDATNSSATKIKMGSDLYGSDTGINIGMFGGGAIGIRAGAGLSMYCGTTRSNATGGIEINTSGNTNVTGALSKASGSFRIPHPLPALNETHNLVHSFIEGPQADLIYRGRVSLVAGKAMVNIDTAATMTEGTFELLCRDVQCVTSNETDWNPVRGSVVGNILTIECQDTTSVATISWMVIGERKDQHMLNTEWTDDDGKVIVEPLKPIPLAVEEPSYTEPE